MFLIFPTQTQIDKDLNLSQSTVTGSLRHLVYGWSDSNFSKPTPIRANFWVGPGALRGFPLKTISETTVDPYQD